MSQKLLVVDDDLEILQMLYDALSDEGYLVYRAQNSSEAIKQLKQHPDLIILDVMMPGQNGFELCKAIRDSVTCPILFLTAKVLESDLIEGLAIGGDDYIKKPFSLRELKARITAHLRQVNRRSEVEPSYLMFQDIKINLKSKEILYKEELISFTKREYKIIELLALNRNQVFSKEKIYEKIWGLEAEGDSQTIAEHVKKIRAKFLKVDQHFNYLKTVWEIGYKWSEDQEGKF